MLHFPQFILPQKILKVTYYFGWQSGSSGKVSVGSKFKPQCGQKEKKKENNLLLNITSDRTMSYI
jgi:hypothetical protein